MGSTEAKINALERKVDNYHIQHKLLKDKVTQLARRIRAIEPFAYTQDRKEFVDLVEVVLDLVKESSKK